MRVTAMITSRICLASFLWASPFLLTVQGQQPVPNAIESDDPSASFIKVACDPATPQELRAFKERQMLRRASYLEQTIVAMKGDAAANARAYTAEDQRDLNTTLQQLGAELAQVRTYNANGCGSVVFTQATNHGNNAPEQTSMPRPSNVQSPAALPLAKPVIAKTASPSKIALVILPVNANRANVAVRSSAPTTLDAAPRLLETSTNASIAPPPSTEPCSTTKIVSNRAAPALNQQIDPGTPVVSGKLDPSAKGALIRICVDDKETTRTKVDDNGSFAVAIPGPLSSGQTIVAQEITSGDASPETYGLRSSPVAVGTGIQCSVNGQGGSGSAPTLDPVEVGDKTISGKVDKATSGTVRICVDGKETAIASLNTDGKFKASLDSALTTGQTVTAQSITPANAAVAAGAGTPTQATQPEIYGPFSSSEFVGEGSVSAFDFGRARTYLSFGGIVSQDQAQFSKLSAYLNFNADYTWYLQKYRQKWHWYVPKQFNNLFDARLTTLPVTSCPQAQPGTTSTQCSSTNFDTFNTATKAALIQLGVYFPYYFKWSSWQWRQKESDGSDKSHRYALFFAPLAKGGFQTLLQPPQSSPTSTTTATPGQSSTATTINGQTFFHYIAPGARIGLFKFHDEHKTSLAPDVITYLDITYGKYENFAQPVGASTTKFTHPYRIGMEGRFMVPKMPAFIGFDSNTRVGNSPGDLRFLVGTTFDMGCLIQKIGLNPGVAGCDPKSTGNTATPPSP